MTTRQNSDPLSSSVKTLHALLEEQQQLIVTQQQRILVLEEYLRLYQQKQFSSSSEQQKSEVQDDLFNEAEAFEESEASEVEVEEAAQDAQDSNVISESAPQTRAKPRGRKPLPEHLPRIRIEHDLSDEEKRCACGCQRHLIGEVSSEQLEIIPAQLRVLLHVRKKYACRRCESAPITAPLPAQPIPKSNAAPGLLAHVAVAKYQDALPLYRQHHILKRHGIELSRQTLAYWMIRSGQLLQPLLNLLQDQLLAGAMIQMDETPIQVLNETERRAQQRSYMWIRRGGEAEKRIILFHYAASRASAVAQQLLDGYQGYLQSDDYAAYHALGQWAGIELLGCWAHARRKFIEAQMANKPKGKNRGKSKSGKADMALSFIGKLYGIERQIKDQPPDERKRVRQQQAKPILQQFRAWLDKNQNHVLPKGLLGKALSYLDKNWQKLQVYLEDGRLEIDNNGAENALRPFVIGRKNWLFSDTAKGAQASAALYSVIETAKANGVEPYHYLKRVFTELPKANCVEEIEALLPWNVSNSV
ncbi:MAG: IS66 family transposase [Gammaproteobacteria bacterium]|nr:IS66 family transposase [Gammaproteobacteria bacterium]